MTVRTQKKDKQRVKRIVQFIEYLIVPSGEGSGKPFKLRKWQRKFIEDVYGPHIRTKGEWRRLVRRAVLSIARKNGENGVDRCVGSGSLDRSGGC